MAEVQREYQDWASRKAGDGAVPQAEQPENDSSSAQQTDTEPPPPPQECVSHAANEITEAIEMLEKAKGQVDDPKDLQDIIDALTEQEQALTEKAKELEEAAAEEEDEEEEDDGTPEPEAV